MFVLEDIKVREVKETVDQRLMTRDTHTHTTTFHIQNMTVLGTCN